MTVMAVCTVKVIVLLVITAPTTAILWSLSHVVIFVGTTVVVVVKIVMEVVQVAAAPIIR